MPDISVTVWMVEALKAAEAVGIDFEAMSVIPTFEGVGLMLRILGSASVSDHVYGSYNTSFGYLYRPAISPPLHAGFGAASDIGRHLTMMTGASPYSRGMIRAADLELARIPDDFEGESYRNYHAHMFMHSMGGTHWQQWESAMREYLVSTNPQATTGHERGSWVIHGTALVPDYCGRLWDTVAGTLALQEYYRNAKSAGPLSPPPIPGDTDGDGDVDVDDILTAFENFTGPNPEPPAAAFTKTASQGDFRPVETGGDGDVDVEDLLLIISAFTGPGGR